MAIGARILPRPDRIATPATGGLALFRAATGLVLVALASYVMFDGVAAANRETRPAIAVQALPFDSLANAQLASRMQINPEAPDDRARARIHGATALMRDPTHAQAARAIGFVALEDADVAAATRAMTYAHWLTRRDLAAELWLIEYNVTRGDTRGALAHFDAALSSSTEIHATLFPVMAGAISDDRLIEPMADLLIKQRWWLPWALRHFADGPPPPKPDSPAPDAERMRRNAVNAAALFSRIAAGGVRFQPETLDALAARLPADRPDLRRSVQSLPRQ
ncbi:hypothetical protein [Sphingomonas sp.]|uniref:hypothetical protein n=1 Tax=Sphingomonas sp. TaxID=28214 RepID=UPI001DA6B042|nr:hypothetical protein [Sphingomonas sp.]MBX9796000.1 hypothetical protein [Sphingomonas sp.]